MVDGPNLYAYVRQNPWTNFDPEGLYVPLSGGGRYENGRITNGGSLFNVAEAAYWNISRGVGNAGDVQTLQRYAGSGFSDMIRPGIENPEAVSKFLMGFMPIPPARNPEEGAVPSKPSNSGATAGQAEAELPVSRPSKANENPGGKSAQATSAESTTQSQSSTDASSTTMVSPRELVSRQGPSEMTGNNVKRLTKDMKANGFDPNHPVEYADVDGRKIIIDGHHRTEAARKAGIQKIPAKEQKVSSERGEKLDSEAREAAAERAARRQ